MKTLELSLNKRLLIVDFDDMDHLENVVSCDKQGIRFCSDNDEPTKIICKGSDLTEEIAKSVCKNMIEGDSHYFLYKNYRSGEKSFTDKALESFISAIESNGWYWGGNPLGKKPELADSRYNEEREFIENNPDELVMGDHYADWSMWQEAESRTFNP